MKQVYQDYVNGSLEAISTSKSTFFKQFFVMGEQQYTIKPDFNPFQADDEAIKNSEVVQLEEYDESEL